MTGEMGWMSASPTWSIHATFSLFLSPLPHLIIFLYRVRAPYFLSQPLPMNSFLGGMRFCFVFCFCFVVCVYFSSSVRRALTPRTCWIWMSSPRSYLPFFSASDRTWTYHYIVLSGLRVFLRCSFYYCCIFCLFFYVCFNLIFLFFERTDSISHIHTHAWGHEGHRRANYGSWPRKPPQFRETSALLLLKLLRLTIKHLLRDSRLFFSSSSFFYFGQVALGVDKDAFPATPSLFPSLYILIHICLFAHFLTPSPQILLFTTWRVGDGMVPLCLSGCHSSASLRKAFFTL